MKSGAIVLATISFIVLFLFATALILQSYNGRRRSNTEGKTLILPFNKNGGGKSSIGKNNSNKNKKNSSTFKCSRSECNNNHNENKRRKIDENTEEKTHSPNFVLLLLDDHGYGDVNVTETPNINEFAKTGMIFTDFHSGATICGPSRASILTGRLGLRTGVTSNFGPMSLGGLPHGELTLADLLKSKEGDEGGYDTHMIGKWHLGHGHGFHPTFRGFDTFYGLPYSGDMGCLDITPQSCKPNVNRSQGTPACPSLCSLDRSTNVVGIPLYDTGGVNCSISALLPKDSINESSMMVEEKKKKKNKNVNTHHYYQHNTNQKLCDETITEQPVDEFKLNQRYADRADEILSRYGSANFEQKHEKPFFLYIGFAHTHTPMAYSSDFRNVSQRPGWKRHYGNTLAELDDAVGRIISSLDKHDLRNDTLVFLTSDNGPADLSRVDCDFIGSPGPYRGLWQKLIDGGGGGGSMKGTVWEGGHRVFTVASWPGHVDNGHVSQELTSALDILPTFCSLAGISLPTDRSFDGIDLSPLLLQETTMTKKKNESVWFSTLKSALSKSVLSTDMSGEEEKEETGTNVLTFNQVVDGSLKTKLERVLFHPSIADHSAQCHLAAVRIGKYKFIFESGGIGACENEGKMPAQQQPPAPKRYHDPPLVFDLLHDPQESSPLVNPPKSLMQSASEARRLKMNDIQSTLSHVADMTVGKKENAPCCNRDDNVCRCNQAQKKNRLKEPGGARPS